MIDPVSFGSGPDLISNRASLLERVAAPTAPGVIGDVAIPLRSCRARDSLQ